MSKKNFIKACREQTNYTVATSRAAFDLFCEIMGYPKHPSNYFIGDDPHGTVDIMEGYRCLNMTDIHVVISEYEHWLEIYKTNDELCKAVDAWYYYCIDWHNQHSYEEHRWVRVDQILPEEDGKTRTSVVVEVYTCGRITTAWYDFNTRQWHLFMGFINPEEQSDVIFDITHWRYLPLSPQKEAERSKGCPNLRSWLAGCPVDGLREATPEWKEEQRKSLEEAHRRTEEAKQALYQAMEEEVKLNKF